jgi:predicted MFS family arabinose efflux permease
MMVSARRRQYALALLILVYVVAFVDRTVVTILLEPIRREFHLSDTQLGFVSGLAFAIAYSAGVIPAGLLADRMRRRVLLAGVVFVWSLLTFVSGFATSFLFLCIARLGVGLVEAGEAPAIMSLIGDLFPARRRATAVALVYLGVPFGLLFGYLVASQIAAAHGWRVAMMAAGTPGLLLSLVLILSLPEPARGAQEDAPPPPETYRRLRYLRGNPALLHALAGGGLASIAASIFAVWLPSLLMRKFSLGIADVGATLGIVLGTGGFLGALLCGPFADRLGKGRPVACARVAAGFIALMAPVALLAFNWPGFAGSVALAACFNFVVPGYLGSLHGLVLGVTPAHLRGFVVALLAMMINLVGYGLGPQMVGVLSDVLARVGVVAPLQLAMSICALSAFWSAGHLLIAGRHLARAQRAVSPPSQMNSAPVE